MPNLEWRCRKVPLYSALVKISLAWSSESIIQGVELEIDKKTFRVPDCAMVAVAGFLPGVEELGSKDDGTWVFWVLLGEFSLDYDGFDLPILAYQTYPNFFHRDDWFVRMSIVKSSSSLPLRWPRPHPVVCPCPCPSKLWVEAIAWDSFMLGNSFSVKIPFFKLPYTGFRLDREQKTNCSSRYLSRIATCIVRGW